MQENNIDKEILWESYGTPSEKQEIIQVNLSDKYFKIIRLIAVIIAVVFLSLIILSHPSLELILTMSAIAILFLFITIKVTNTRTVCISSSTTISLKHLKEPLNPIAQKSHYVITNYYLIIEDFINGQPTNFKIPFSYINKYEIINSTATTGTLRIEAEVSPDKTNNPNHTKTTVLFIRDVGNPTTAFNIINEICQSPEIAEARQHRQIQNKTNSPQYYDKNEKQNDFKTSSPFKHQDTSIHTNNNSYKSNLNDSQIHSKLN